MHNLEVVVARQPGNAVGAGDAHLVLGLRVVRREVGEADRPIQQVRVRQRAIGGAGLELVLLEPQAGPSPVHGGAADRLDDPGRQVREILAHAPGAGRRPHVLPGKLSEARPLVVHEVRRFVTVPGLEDHHADALLRQFVAERAAAGAGADDDDHAIVV